MKKYFLSIVALAGMLFATSCQESLVEPQVGGPTTFTVQVPDQMGTKAIGDASIIDRLYVAVYPNFDETLTVPQDLTAIYKTQADVLDGTATVRLNLIQDQKYDIVFWAQNGTSYVNENSELLSIPMDKKFHNNEAGAAFFHFEQNFDPTQIRTKGIQLRRPFAQLNLGTTPASLKTDVQSDSLKLFKSYIKVGNIATSFNTVKGYGEGSQEVEFSLASVPADEKLYVAGEKYYYVSMDYLPIAGDNEALVTVNAKITLNNESGPVVSHDFTNVPVRENYRTNIVGNLISSTTDFVVEVNDDWAGTYDRKIVEVSNATDLQEAINSSEVGEVVLTQDITLNQILEFKVPTPPTQSNIARLSAPGRNIVFDGNGRKLTSTAGRAINVDGVDGVTIKNLVIECTGERAINIINGATNVNIDNVTATAANYTVNVAGSAPGAVVNIENSTLNGLCTVNVAGAGAEVSVNKSTVNCNDNNTTVGESYAALGLNKDAVNGTIIASDTEVNVTEGSDSHKGRNGAENGTVIINGSTEDVLVMVAAITYPGSDYYHAFTSLGEAIEFAKAGETITLLRNVKIPQIDLKDCKKNVIIDCNDKTIETTEAYGVVINAGEWSSVVLQNGNIKMTYKGNYGAAYAAGFKIENGDYTGKTITLESCTITMANTDWAYAINMPASVKGLNLVINECKLTGAIALQCWGDNNIIELSNSELICNYTTNAQYTSGCVALQKDDYGNAAENNQLKATGCHFKYDGIDNFNSTIYSIVDYNGNQTSNTIEMENCTFEGVKDEVA